MQRSADATSVSRGAHLTLAVVQAAVDGTKPLPVMTPRISVNLRDRRRARSITSGFKGKHLQRDSVPDRNRLKAEAGLPSYMWTAKRARAILARLDGADHDQIAKDLNVSEASVTRWIADYNARGADGWRAYHTPVSRLAASDLELERRLTAAVAVARCDHKARVEEWHGRRTGPSPREVRGNSVNELFGRSRCGFLDRHHVRRRPPCGRRRAP